MSALQKDREAIHTLLGLIAEARSKQQIRAVSVFINELSHYIGGYVGGDQEKQLTQLVDVLWQDMLAML